MYKIQNKLKLLSQKKKNKTTYLKCPTHKHFKKSQIS